MTAKPLVVLVHGAWLGGFCWHALTPLLSRHGYAVLAPSLSGRADTGLHAHTAEIVDLVSRNGAEDIVLVGHSYGAVVASDAAAALEHRVRALIVLDGFIAEAGRSIIQSYGDVEQMFAPLIAPDAPAFYQPLPPPALGLPDTPETAWLAGAMRPMPVRAFTEPARASADALNCLRRYLRFSGFPYFAATAKHAAATGWQVDTLADGHMAITTNADAVAERIART